MSQLDKEPVSFEQHLQNLWLKCHKPTRHWLRTYRQKIKHGETVHVCWEQAVGTFLQERLGGVGRLQENGGVTLFLKDNKKTHMRKL